MRGKQVFLLFPVIFSMAFSLEGSMFESNCRQTILFAKKHNLESFCFLKYTNYLYNILISILALNGAVSKT
jgi:hypothetical protein